MVILTRSRRLRMALRTVLAKIPRVDRQAIELCVAWIRTDRVWQEEGWLGFGLEQGLSKEAGGLFPLYTVGRPTTEYSAQIRFSIPVCGLFSDKALAGIVADELAHAVRAAQIGPGWHEKM